MSEAATLGRPATRHEAEARLICQEAADLANISLANGGLVRPPDVVEYARTHTKSPLHKRFTWDDGEAAKKYRLWQAREIIAQFSVESQPERKPVRMFLSLLSDRHEEGGYRTADDVLADPERRAEWRQMAIQDLTQWVERFGALTELKTVFAAVKRVVKQYEE